VFFLQTLESSLEQAKAQFSADKDALKEEMKKLNEDWTRRFQALQGSVSFTFCIVLVDLIVIFCDSQA
jgi:hypothetical protein